MRWSYHCPICGAHLNPATENIVLLADCEFGRGLFLFNETPGNYSLSLPENITLEKGQIWEFLCPVCRGNLTSKANPNIAMIRVIVDQGKDYAVFFSKVAGEQATFVVNAEGAEVYGPHAVHYEDMVWNKFF